jgi:peptidoglycan/xylan/chitin deacetylase (PgdA/CDA1 family)
MLFLVVNFHYIHEENKYPFPSIYPTPPERLLRQLEQLAQYFDFIGQDDLINAIEGKKRLPKSCCLVTFDDGLKNQYQNALPILKEKGIPAIFFVNTLPIEEKKGCLVHKIHWLRANLDPVDFSMKLDNNLQELSGKKLKDFPTKEEKISLKYPYDTLEVAKLKFNLNYVIPNQYREKIIDKIFKEIVDDEAQFCQKIYMSEKEIKNLAELSLLGTHSQTHRVFSQLSGKQIAEDIKNSLTVLHKLTGNKKIVSISYPYGDIDKASQLVKICQSLGLKLGFTTERSFNSSLYQPLLFARLDANDILGGKFAGFDFEGDNIKILDEKISLSRQLYSKD